jgi:DNA polymerase-3 subunit gamma/tau
MIVTQFGLVRSEIYHELNEAIVASEPQRALRLVDQLLTAGQSLDVFAMGVVTNFRNLLLIKIDPELTAALNLPPEQVETLTRQAESFAAQDLLALIDRASYYYERIHRSTQPRILLEAALVEFTLFESRVLLSDLVRRLQELTGDERPATSESGASAASSGGSAKSAATIPAAPRSGREAGKSSLARETAPSQGTTVGSAAETLPGWTAFIQTLLASHPGQASCLMEGLPSLDEASRCLIVAFPPDKTFQMHNLERERSIIEPRAAEVWGSGLKLQFVTSAQDESSRLCEDVRRQVAPTVKESLEAVCQEDRPLSDLVELLEGEPVPDQEREAWYRESNTPAPAPPTPRDDHS